MATKKNIVKASTLSLENDEPSLLFAIDRLIKSGGADFDEWWKLWEDGYLERDDKKSNFKLAKWRKTGEKPFYIEVTPKEKTGGVRAFEYFPNKKDLTTSYFIAGNDSQIINHIIQIEYEGGGSGQGSFSGKNSKPPLEGFPLITLTFYQRNSDIRKRSDGSKKSPTRGIKYLRMPGFTDNQAIADMGLAELVKQSDVRKWANGICNNFALPRAYEWEKGKSTLSYMGMIPRLQGLEGYAFCQKEAEGIKLFTTMLAAVGKKPDPLAFHFSGSTNPAKKYPVVRGKKKLLGEEWDEEDKRPTDTVVFSSAELWLPTIEKHIPLVRGNVILYKN